MYPLVHGEVASSADNPVAVKYSLLATSWRTAVATLANDGLSGLERDRQKVGGPAL